MFQFHISKIISYIVYMDRYYFIACEDLVYIVKRNGKYDLPKIPFEIPFPIKKSSIINHEIITNYVKYELILCIADIEFPGITENWKRQSKLIISRQLSEVLIEAICMYHPYVRSAVFPITEDNKIILAKPTYFDYFEIPGGAIDYLGNPEETAVKEAFEETGVIVVIKNYLRTRSYILEHINPQLRINPRWFISIEYIGKVIGGVPQPKNEIEKIAIENISDILNGKSKILVRNDLIEGLKQLPTCK